MTPIDIQVSRSKVSIEGQAFPLYVGEGGALVFYKQLYFILGLVQRCTYFVIGLLWCTEQRLFRTCAILYGFCYWAAIVY